ncbi:MAG: galactitol-1-phosphate 5-dehydrogenase [Oscillospiraceae bacterium]|nr:galactitol-1-phosphate 5-dehydrogenase [Oscillospiraceae bacterium]
MKACVLHGIGDLRYEEIPLPELEPGQVRLRIRACGICGSDLPRVFEKGTYSFPTVPGHELAGDIIAAADSENEGLIGKRAAVFPLMPCFSCGPCSVGEYAQCESYDYYGSRRDGGFAEYLNVNVWNLVIVPDSVPYELAAMCEPIAVAIHALGQGPLYLGDMVVISGAGTIGLIMAQLAVSCGASKVTLLDVDQQRLAYAKKLGFVYALNTAECDVVQEVQAITGDRGADLAIEGAGVGASLQNCLKVARNFGRIVLMGNPAGQITLDQKSYWEILRKQLMLKGTWNSCYNLLKNDWRTAIEAIRDSRLMLEPLITHRFSLLNCNKAFDVLLDKAAFALKVMFVNDS